MKKKIYIIIVIIISILIGCALLTRQPSEKEKQKSLDDAVKKVTIMKKE